ncbi:MULTISPECIES: cytochrome c biogenesis CcdA family protein [Micromonospora]|uniref:Cytochrome c biogenesis protein CcdA n=1 Tax=Micromonospora solifontis TaxID=2487138 RepID=A0ABX9WD15_9ACTN|nr:MULTISPECIES: cytochrome c biogenesis protein CcdA [Micromonospora]NES15810.1 cytochrome c biogenesis protein CcdA [Micromonospora sp. PPF5-17B]NES38077.1 cytochrome c biogenesis protein CcdA [Micromonospora solifontis]NES56656.1 cytochrome c biogenesis protein CcdA [Micromonospora sp. PPF5-6]RNL97082.1 cytochrome c biogenesis protein CcdA [Micromonospora solifontis]
MGETFRQLAESGPLLLAVGAAALAGLVSFLSPCVLPLMPGYLSYVTGLAGADLERKGPLLTPQVEEGPPANASSGGGVAVAALPQARGAVAVKGRVLAGTMLFIAGFTVVFTATAILFSGVGKLLFQHERTLEVVIGALVVLLGLGYLGVVPGMQREFRIHRLPAAGLLGAPVLGAVFALSWMPCTGPTLGAVLGMATVDGRTDRAVLLAVAYCLGLGVPFVVFGLGFHRLLGVFRAVRRNSRWVTRIGGALLILIGLALVTGGWQDFVIWLQTHVGVGEVSI